MCLLSPRVASFFVAEKSLARCLMLYRGMISMVAVDVDLAVVLHVLKVTCLGDSTAINKKPRPREKG